MMSVASFSLSHQNASFVKDQAQKRCRSRSKVVNQALDLYRKYQLRQEMTEGLSRPRSQEDQDWIEGDLEAYALLIEQG